MALDYRVTPLPAVWPGKATPGHGRKRAPFKAIWTRTLALLEREIRMLGGRNVEIAVDVNERHLRNDGQLRADARPYSSSVIVSFSVDADRLQFPADRFGFWQDNVDAVARALEALRLVDRYGVQQGRQYAGFKALPSTTGATLTTEQAADILGTHSGIDVRTILFDRDVARTALRRAMANTHPDKEGGAAAVFSSVQHAKRVLEAHHGGTL